MELHLQPQQPHPSSLDPHTSSPLLSHPINAPPCLNTLPPPHTQSIQTDTHHHFYTSLTPPPPSLPEHTHTSTPPVNQRPGCHAVTDSMGEKGKGKMAGKVSISPFITLSRPSRWWHKEEKEKKECGESKREGDMDGKNVEGLMARGGCRREFKCPIFSLADNTKNQAGHFTGVICVFFFFCLGLTSIPTPLLPRSPLQ